MTTSAADHKARRRRERERRIVVAARALAEQQGWESVTTRRLADTIGYSQPVLYGHFPEGRTQIVTAVALAGFGELAAELSESGSGGGRDDGAHRLRAVITTYLDFAERHPATYDAMFGLPIRAPFAAEDTPRVMQDGFDAIVAALADLARAPSDLGTAAEVLWGAMHGVATLQRAGRFVPDHQQRRVDELVRRFGG